MADCSKTPNAFASPTPKTMSDQPSKAEEINLVLSERDVDLWKLRELALTEGGLINDTLRKRAWPKLVGLHGSPVNDDKVRPSRLRPPLIPRATASSSNTTVVSNAPTTRSGLTRSNSLPKNMGRNGQNDDDNDDSSVEESDSSVVTDPTSPARRKKNRQDSVVAECLDAEQIERDVARCTWHLLTGSQRARRFQMKNKSKKRVSSLLRKKQSRLGNLINLTLLQSDQNEQRLCYYQGYHDVACIFLSALGGGGSGPTLANSNTSLEATAVAMGLDLPSRVLLQVSESHFRDAMRSNFMELQAALRLVLMPLIGAFDSQVYTFLADCEMEPYFALSWIITWFSHDIRDTTLVKRLFDAFLVSHPLFPIYMSVAMVLHPTNRMDVLSADWADFASVHHALTGLPKNSCSVGWKYKVGDGYVSGDEDEDDCATRSTDMDVSLASEDLLELRDDDASECQSMISSNLIHVGSNTRVPFQELIDMAITYMRRIPPRNLLKLARRFHLADKSLLAQASSIALLQPPPSWGLASTTPSDWVLKQRTRQSRGMSATSRKDRRKRNRSRSRSRTRQDERHPPASSAKNDADKENEKEEEIKRYLIEKQKTLAVIASGYGPGDYERQRRRKRRRKILLRASVAVALVAIAYGVAVQYRPDLLGREIEADSQQHDIASDHSKPLSTKATERTLSTKATERTLSENASTVRDIASRWGRSEEVVVQGREGTEKASSATLPGQDETSIRENFVVARLFMALDFVKGRFEQRFGNGNVEGIWGNHFMAEATNSSDTNEGILIKAARMGRAANHVVRVLIREKFM